MSVGLDLGTTEFRSIQMMNHLVARRCRAAYLAVSDTPGHRKLLDHLQVNHARCADDLVVLGMDAFECASMLDLTPTSLLRHGRIPSADPVARQIVSLMIEAILPPADVPGSICSMTLPGGYIENDDLNSLDSRFLQQLVSLRGYTPRVTFPSVALVVAELSASSFSGLGISLGATNSEIGVIHCGRELVRWSTSANLSELSEEFPIDHAQPEVARSMKPAWDRACLRRLNEFLSEGKEVLEGHGAIRLIPQPANVVCSGGITSAPGFAQMFEQAWSMAKWSIPTAAPRFAENPGFVVARGCLIQAIMEGHSLAKREAA